MSVDVELKVVESETVDLQLNAHNFGKRVQKIVEGLVSMKREHPRLEALYMWEKDLQDACNDMGWVRRHHGVIVKQFNFVISGVPVKIAKAK